MSSLTNYFKSTMNGKKLRIEEEMQYEVLRLASFETWPEWAVKRPINLAANGFYYCGDKDRVKCFSCGGEISNWSLWQDVTDEHKIRFPQCALVCGLTDSNKIFDSCDEPNADIDELLKAMKAYNVFSSQDALYHNQQKQLSTNCSEHKAKLQESQEYRSATFVGKWKNNVAPTPTQLARAGFYYVGPADTVKCAFCNGKLLNWKLSDDPLFEHKKHYPRCTFVTSVPDVRSMFQNATEARTGINIHARPDYASEEARLKSFRNWPKKMIVSPKELAAAGFYYLGYSDNVKCFSCDGGLRNWEIGDDPWREHTRWFCKCAFLKEIKGEQYIQDIVNQFAKNVEVTETNKNISGESSQNKSCCQATSGKKTKKTKEEDPTTTSAGMKESSMSRRQKKNRNKKKKTGQLNGEATSSNKQMQFSNKQENGMSHEMKIEEPGLSHEQKREQLCVSYKEKNDQSGVSYKWKNEQSNPDYDKKKESNMNHEGKNDEEGTVENQYNVKDYLAAAIERIKEERMCKICMDAPCDIVLLPCRHMMCCYECAPALRTCPLCRGHIKETIRVYGP